MTIYGNITFHACLELVTSQDWRHNITFNQREGILLWGLFR